MKIKKRSISVLHLLFVVIVFLTGCNLPQRKGDNTSTPDVTQAYQTVQARLTEASTQTVIPSATVTPTVVATATPTPTTAAATTTTTPSQPPPPVTSCDMAEAGIPIDVTIPDDTQMPPGQPFTKVWKLKNVGTCTWTKAYSISLFSGDAMGAPAVVPLPNDVPQGQTIDISVDMVAPLVPKTYQGYWKLKNASGAWFGLGPGAGPFWVKIQVVGSGTPGSPTVTSTTGSGIVASGTRTLSIADTIDLDTGGINSGSGADLAYQIEANAELYLVPGGGTVIALFGPGQPTLQDCQAASLGASPIIVKGNGLQYLCYRTGQGLYGSLYLQSFQSQNLTLTIKFVTWAGP